MTGLTFNEYQDGANGTNLAVHPTGSTVEIVRIALGVPDEAGELAGALKKYLREDFGPVGSPEALQELRSRVQSEMGDVFWYLAVLCTELGLSMEHIARRNLIKLKARQAKGTLQGDGEGVDR